MFGNSMFTRFAYAGDRPVGAGRALADGLDCAYVADVAVYPDHQGLGLGLGLGKTIIRQPVEAAQGHKKIILYATPGPRASTAVSGFLKMNTAMGIWQDPARAIEAGVLSTD